MGWSAVLTSLLMPCPFDREVTHLSLDDAWIASVSALRVDLVDHFDQQHLIVIFVVYEGGKNPVSRLGTG